MKLSVFLDHLLRAAEQTGLPLAEVIAQAQQEGLHAVECDLAALEQETIRRTLRETNMAVSGIYTSFDFRLKGYEEGVKRLLDRAAEMNAGCVMPLPGLLREGEDLEATRRVMADGVSRVCELAKAYGIQVVLEDFGSPRAPFGPLQGLSWFLEQVPALGCALDSGNFRIHAQDALAAYEQLAPRVRHVHLKSWIDRPDYGEELIPAADGFQCYPAPLGHGPVPNEAVVRALVRDHYEGFCAIEHFSVRDQLSCMIESARWLRGVLASA